MNQFKNHYNFEFTPETMSEKSTIGSKTQPGMAMSIKEIMKRSELGEPVVTYPLEYGGEELNPLYNPDLDLTDITNIQNAITELNELLEQQQNEAVQAESVIENEGTEAESTPTA